MSPESRSCSLRGQIDIGVELWGLQDRLWHERSPRQQIVFHTRPLFQRAAEEMELAVLAFGRVREKRKIRVGGLPFLEPLDSFILKTDGQSVLDRRINPRENKAKNTLIGCQRPVVESFVSDATIYR